MSQPSETRAPLVSHVSVGVTDLQRAGAFYDAVMATIGARRIMEHAVGIGYGRTFPEFWAARPHDGGQAAAGNGTHVCFNAPDAAAVGHDLDRQGGGHAAPGRAIQHMASTLLPSGSRRKAA